MQNLLQVADLPDGEAIVTLVRVRTDDHQNFARQAEPRSDAATNRVTTRFQQISEYLERRPILAAFHQNICVELQGKAK